MLRHGGRLSIPGRQVGMKFMYGVWAGCPHTAESRKSRWPCCMPCVRFRVYPDAGRAISLTQDITGT